MWKGGNPTEKISIDLPPPVVLIDTSSDADNRRYSHSASNYCRSVPGNRLIVKTLDYIGMREGKFCTLADD